MSNVMGSRYIMRSFAGRRSEIGHTSRGDIVLVYADGKGMYCSNPSPVSLRSSEWEMVDAHLAASGWFRPSLLAPDNNCTGVPSMYGATMRDVKVIKKTSYDLTASNELTPTLIRELWQELYENHWLFNSDVFRRIYANPVTSLLLLEEPSLAKIVDQMPRDSYAD